MPTLSVIKDFDVLENIGPGFGPCPIVTPMDSFPFEQGKETFPHRIIITIPLPTHATRYSLVLENPLEVLAGILTPSIGVMNEARNCGASP